MQCNKDSILLYSSHELSDEETILLEAHLESCQDCQQTLAEIQVMTESFKDLPQLNPSYDILESVLNKRTLLDRIKAFLESLNPKILAGATLSILVLSIILPFDPPPERLVETPDPDYIWRTDFHARELRYRIQKISPEATDREHEKTPSRRARYKTLKRRIHLVRKSSW